MQIFKAGKAVFKWITGGFGRFYEAVPKFKIPDLPKKAPKWIPGWVPFKERVWNVFKTGVKINNPRYDIDSENLDYNLISKNALFFGPTLIKGNDYEIHCEKGNFDLESSIGNFQKNPKIFYNNKIIEGDSIFYDESINYASATKRVVITDTINNSIIKGEYGEIYKDKYSAIITKRALAINII